MNSQNLADLIKETIMGNAARIQSTLNGLTKVDTSCDNSNSGAVINSCLSCGVTFNPLFKRRKVCAMCLEPHCSTCLVRQQTESGLLSSSHRCCNRCRVFSNPNLSWDDLMQLRARDLRWFLARQQVNTDDIKEKEQLAEIILEQCGSDAYQRRRVFNQQRVAEMALVMEAMRVTEPPISNNAQSSELPSAPPSFIDSVQESGASVPTQLTSQRVEETHLVDVESEETNMLHPQRIYLDNIANDIDIEVLSVKQLKDLLAYHFVDYKGCVEKHELLTRVRRLWHSHMENKAKMLRYSDENDQQPNKAATTSEPMEDSELCKICMDAPVDCVLLECGHMVTCVHCGKRMHECPICRQFVVRTVRIFKS